METARVGLSSSSGMVRKSVLPLGMGLLLVLLLGGIWYLSLREGGRGSSFVTTGNSELEIEIGSEIPGVKIKTLGNVKAWLVSSLSLLRYQEPYRFSIFGTNQSVAARKLRFVYRPMNSLTFNEKQALYNKNFYGEDMIVGYKNAVDDKGNLTVDVYFDTQVYTFTEQEDWERSMAFYVFFGLHTMNPNFAQTNPEFDTMMTNFANLELPLAVSLSDKVSWLNTDYFWQGTFELFEQLQTFIGSLRFVGRVWAIPNCSGFIECGGNTWDWHCQGTNTPCIPPNDPDECGARACVNGLFCTNPGGVPGGCGSSDVGGTCGNPTCPFGIAVQLLITVPLLAVGGVLTATQVARGVVS